MSCAFCKKKILMTFMCKCNSVYCIQHRYPEVHNCTFDYLKHNQDHLRNNMQVVNGVKITKI